MKTPTATLIELLCINSSNSLNLKVAERLTELDKQLHLEAESASSAWTNRDHFCRYINVIGKEIIGPRINAFKGDCCAPEAVARETLNLIVKLEAENAALKARIRQLESLTHPHCQHGISVHLACPDCHRIELGSDGPMPGGDRCIHGTMINTGCEFCRENQLLRDRIRQLEKSMEYSDSRGDHS